MERIIINIDKGPKHIYENLKQSGIEVEKPEPSQPSNAAWSFSAPNIGWNDLAAEEE